MIEFLVAIALTSIIFVVISSVIISTMQTSTKNKQSQILEQTKNDLAADLSNNIKWATRITVGAGSDSFILTNDATPIEYKLDAKSIVKDGSALTPTRISVTAFTVTRRLSSLEITVDMEDTQNTAIKDTLSLILSPRGKNVLE
jgi:ABC-type Na+ efflux pump permease subunit